MQSCLRALSPYRTGRHSRETVYDVAPSDLAFTHHKADLDFVSDGGIQTYAAGVRNGAGRVRMVRFYRGVVCNDGECITGIVGAQTQ